MSVHPLNIIVREVENPRAILYRLEKDIFVFFISSIVELGRKGWEDVGTILKPNLGKSLMCSVSVTFFPYFFNFLSQHKDGKVFASQQVVSDQKFSKLLCKAMEATSNHIHMVNLNGSKWMIWKSKMEDLLYCKDLFAPVEGDSAKPETTSENDWKKLNWKAVGYIR